MSGTLREKIIGTKLTRKESDVAEYILNNLYEVCFMTASDLAKKLDTSNTSVNRTARALGYHVFADLQKELRVYVSTHAGQIDGSSLPLNQRIRLGDSEEDLYFRMCRLFSESIAQMMQKNSLDKVDAVVELLSSSKNRYVVGYRNTVGIANKLAFLLQLIVNNVILCDRGSVMTINTLMDAGPKDCIVIFSFSRYYKITQQIIEYCHSRKSKIVLVTDRFTTPFSHLVDHIMVVEADSLSYFNSNVTAMCMLEVISAKLALRRGDDAIKRIRQMEPHILELQI